MTKPIYKSIEYSVTLPISKHKVVFKPFTVGDERQLIIAATTRKDDVNFYANNTLKVIQNCILNDVKVRSLPAVDVKYLFLQQRSKSVGPLIEFMWDKVALSADIDEFYIAPERTKDDYHIDIGNGFKIKMKDISFEDELRITASMSDKSSDKEIADCFYRLMLASIQMIYSTESEDDIWTVGEGGFTLADAEAFINDIPSQYSQSLLEFVINQPQLTVKVENPETGEMITIDGSQTDFLSFRSGT